MAIQLQHRHIMYKQSTTFIVLFKIYFIIAFKLKLDMFSNILLLLLIFLTKNI